MKWITLLPALILASGVSIIAQADERAVYVGEGRYACSNDSSDCAVVRQRNEEQTRRVRERDDYERRSDRQERREREYERDYESDRY